MDRNQAVLPITQDPMKQHDIMYRDNQDRVENGGRYKLYPTCLQGDSDALGCVCTTMRDLKSIRTLTG